MYFTAGYQTPVKQSYTPYSQSNTVLYESWQPALEQIVFEQPVHLVLESKQSRINYSSLYLSPKSNVKSNDYFVVDSFLTHSQPAVFVGDAKDVEEFAREAFKTTTGMNFPSNLMLNVCSQSVLKSIHESRCGSWQDNIVGFSFNGQGKKTSEVFILAGDLDRVMLTLGHEIGHVIAPTLNDARDEEAKAFAFSLAWMQAIVNNNIAGLAKCINPTPAKNGLHDVAFNFVSNKIKEGNAAFSLFEDLINNVLSMQNILKIVSRTASQ